MKFNKAIVALILAIVMIMGLASVAMAEDALKIGVIGPFTGAAAIYGNACKFGAQVAAEEINAQGGLQIELLNEDDEHDPEKSLNAYNTVLDNGAQMIAGTTTTTPCIAVGAQAYEDRVFMLTPSASSAKVPEGKDNMYQVCFEDPAMGIFSAQIISENNLGTKIAVIYNNADVYSTGIRDTFVAQAAELGLDQMSDEERAAMGARGREWIRRDFSWKGIGAQMKAAYEWLLISGKKDRPNMVRVD